MNFKINAHTGVGDKKQGKEKDFFFTRYMGISVADVKADEPNDGTTAYLTRY